jgi:hypothetical protein
MNDGAHNELLDRGLEDILQLSEMASVVQRHLGGSPSETQVMQATTETIGVLLDAGYAIVGNVAKDDEGILYISSWGLGSADTIKRIKDEWFALERPPSLGDVCWLELTESGRAHALAVFRPRYMIHQGSLYVWFSGERSVERPTVDCLVGATDTGELVGVEIPNCRRQLKNVSFPAAQAHGAFQWSYDGESDTFSVRIGKSGGPMHEKSSGRARVDDRRVIIDLQVILGSKVASDDRELTF